MNPFQEIETERFRLRKIVDNDLDFIYQGLSHPEVIKYYGISFTTKEATKEQMTWFENLEKNGAGRWWVISEKESGEDFGAVGFNDLSTVNQSAEIGMWLLPKYWGRGTLTEVMPRVLDYGFQELDLRRIQGFVESDNQLCKNALAKIDFQYEGTMRECEKKGDRFISVDIYAKLRGK